MNSSIEKAIRRLEKVKEKHRTALDGVEVESEYTQDTLQTQVHIDHSGPSTTEKGLHSGVEVDIDSDSDTQQQNNSELDVERVEKEIGLSNKNGVELDYETLHALGFITPKHREENLEEEYRILKRPILMNAFGKGAAPVPKGNLVMVTSAAPGEGKSFTAMNLAISMAKELDSTVLLIDGDVIRASLSKTLNVNDQAGLTDLLEEKVQGVEEVIISTDNPKLKIIPAGLRQTYSTELLASDRMASIAEELASRYPDRIILFDAPPLLATTEAVVLTHIMGQVLVVVEAGKSKVHEIKAALSKIDAEKVVGLVLNKSRKNASGYYGGYYGNYAQ